MRGWLPRVSLRCSALFPWLRSSGSSLGTRQTGLALSLPCARQSPTSRACQPQKPSERREQSFHPVPPSDGKSTVHVTVPPAAATLASRPRMRRWIWLGSLRRQTSCPAFHPQPGFHIHARRPPSTPPIGGPVSVEALRLPLWPNGGRQPSSALFSCWPVAAVVYLQAMRQGSPHTDLLGRVAGCFHGLRAGPVQRSKQARPAS